MSENASFRGLIQRVRTGDAQAAAELVRQYEPTIRLVVRRRLTSPALRRLLDSVDICQSVLASFFVRAAAGQYELDTPEQLLRLLAAMARNKLDHQVKKQHAARRDCRRLDPGPETAEPTDPEPSPSEQVAGKELLDRFRRGLSDEERALADRRAQGMQWSEIATELGGTPDGLRSRLSRAIDRVTRELGLET